MISHCKREGRDRLSQAPFIMTKHIYLPPPAHIIHQHPHRELNNLKHRADSIFLNSLMSVIKPDREMSIE
jgi:hypothetical protein